MASNTRKITNYFLSAELILKSRALALCISKHCPGISMVTVLARLIRSSNSEY